MDVRSVIRNRHSTRRYSDRKVTGKRLDHLLDLAARAERWGDVGVRVGLVNGREAVAQILARYGGVYGLVEGAPHLFVGVLETDNELARLTLGNVMEQVVLEATALGLSTCWMTGSYYPDQAAEKLVLRPGELVAGAVALGYAREDRKAKVHDWAIHRLISSHRRRPLEKLVFDGQWWQPWSSEDADPVLVEILEHVRLSPSARNGQPWRFLVREETIALALTRPAPIDGGIAMAHMTLVAAELARPGVWDVCWRDPALSKALGLPAKAVPVGTFSL